MTAAAAHLSKIRAIVCALAREGTLRGAACPGLAHADEGLDRGRLRRKPHTRRVRRNARHGSLLTVGPKPPPLVDGFGGAAGSALSAHRAAIGGKADTICLM